MTRALPSILALALFVSVSARAEGTLIPLKENGPRDKRINVVVLAEGYTAGEQAKFQTDAAAVVNYMFSAQFYKEYEPYFNSYLIFVASNQSGSDNPQNGVTRDTYFNSTYGSFGIQRLLTIPFGATGEDKAVALLEQLLPDYDIPIVLVNDQEYGGSGGSIAVCSVNAAAPEILVHEVGHSFVDLADEYDDIGGIL